MLQVVILARQIDNAIFARRLCSTMKNKSYSEDQRESIMFAFRNKRLMLSLRWNLIKEEVQRSESAR
jgi:hypothetical protein